ncbi:MAG: hypothetical protein R3Y33_06950 [Clostridia bacterium]
MYIIKNEEIEFSVKKKGAELCSIIKNNRQYIWQADPKFWGNHGPLLFPIVGSVENDEISVCGQRCNLTAHGFLRYMDFDLIEQTENKLVLEAKYNEDTLKIYPIKFRFIATYSYENGSFVGTYDIYNLDEKTMPYCFGLHNGFYCVQEGEDVSNVYFKFDKKITINKPSRVQEKFMDFSKRISVIENSDILNLNDDWYPTQAPINDDVKFSSFELINKKSGKILDYSFSENFGLYNIWRQKNSPFVCLEPWTSQCGVYPFAKNLEDIKTTKYLKSNDKETYFFSVKLS